LIGLLLTASLTGILFAAQRLLGLPFVPFDLFDWTTRLLPGSVVTTGIDLMVKIIRGLHLGGTSPVAKTMEQLMAVGGFLAGGCVLGALFFWIVGRRPRLPALFAGTVLGGVLGLAAAAIGAGLEWTSGVTPWLGIPWVLVTVVSWGTLLGWSQRRLSGLVEAGIPLPGDAVTVERIDRRHFLVRMGTTAAAIAVSGAIVGALPARRRTASARPWSSDHVLPNADDPLVPAPGTRSELTPVPDHYRTDIDTMPPHVDAGSWRIRIEGLVANPRELTLQEIRDRYPPMHQFVTLECISNPIGGDLIGTQRWTGVSLQHVLPDLGLRADATHLRISSVDGYFEVIALETIRKDPRVMLTYAWDGLPLTAVHGSPLRIYIPDVYGMKQPKWIQSIEAIDRWEAGYWVVRGWDRTAKMLATSVIDTVDVEQARQKGGRALLPIGGIAFAGDRGISKVQLQVDDGPWQDARLRRPLSQTTWVLWRLDWPFEAGRHVFTVRCLDGDGAPQIATSSPPHPSGATGLDSVQKNL
jgi:DMSO/TMAO reductase YedYZ molybdopterin-dependent catalytic subunit